MAGAQTYAGRYAFPLLLPLLSISPCAVASRRSRMSLVGSIGWCTKRCRCVCMGLCGRLPLLSCREKPFLPHVLSVVWMEREREDNRRRGESVEKIPLGSGGLQVLANSMELVYNATTGTHLERGVRGRY